jgi:hypothetical protein
MAILLKHVFARSSSVLLPQRMVSIYSKMSRHYLKLRLCATRNFSTGSFMKIIWCFFLGIYFVFFSGESCNSQLVAQTVQTPSDSSVANPAKSDSVRTVVRSPRGAMLRSLLVPGWGQFYNGKWFKGILAAGGETGLIANAIIQNQYATRATTKLEKEFYQDNRRLVLWWLGAVLLYSIADAYVDAQLDSFDESPKLSFFGDNKSLRVVCYFYF